MKDDLGRKVSVGNRVSACIGLRVYGVLAIAFGVLQASLLVVNFPPSPRLEGGMYMGVLIGILGILVFLLVRWAVTIFVFVSVIFGAVFFYASITSQPIEWAIAIWGALLLVVVPVGLLCSSWSSLR